MFSKKLIRGLRKGDGESYSRFISDNYSLYFSFALALLKDRDASKDIVQNVFLKLYLHRKDIDEEKDLHNFILKSIRLEVRNYLRLSYNSKRSKDMSEIPLTQDAYSPVYYSETLSALKDILALMPERRRQVFMMSRFHGKSTQEIAEILGITEKTVHKHLELAMKQIRSTLVS